MKHIEKFLTRFEKQGLYPDFHTITEGVNEPVCIVNGKKYLMFCSNNYLGLTQNEAIKTAAKKAIDKYGVGPGGSRVISGNIDIIEELESKIAELTGTEDCLTFPTGYMANVSVVRAVTDPLFYKFPIKSEDSVIFSDEYNHGSIIDGCRLAKATRIIFKHDDLNDLAQKIKENNLPNKLIITEGVFSLDGEIINIPDYVDLAKKTGSKLMVDDAHGVGVLGQNGGGVIDLFSCGKDVDIVMGCMDKAFGGAGGYLCGKKSLIRYLRIACRGSILSSAFSTMAAGAMIEAVNQIKKAHKEREELISKARYLKSSLINLGFKVYGKHDLPAISVHIGSDERGLKFSRMLWESKIFCQVFRFPAVPFGTSRLRVTVMSTHSYDQLDKFSKTCAEIGKSLKIIK